MQSVMFWNRWSKDYRLFLFFCALLFSGSLAFLWFSYFKGPANIIYWEKQHEQKSIETTAHTFEVGSFEFSIPIESYLTFEYFRGSPVYPDETVSYVFIGGLMLCVLIVLTVITAVPRFWYFTGMGLFILFLVSLRLEVLRLFGVEGQVIPVCIMAVYLLIAFYFGFIRTATAFIIRFLVFFAVTAILAVIIYFFAGVYYPFLHLSVTGYASGLILSVIFIFMVAHEIPAAFIYLTAQGTATGKSLRHFSIISVVYLVNLWLIYFQEAGILEWNFFYINLYLLISISALLGIWGFKNREVLYGGIAPFYPLGGYFIVSLATVLFLTTGFLLSNHNDPALRIIRDFIIFSHIGYGIIFLTYVFSNFILLLAQNLPVHKVLYQPNRMPYFTFRLAGFIATLAFIFYMDWKEYVYHSLSGFYNHMGDLYQKLEQPAFAEAYYIKGKSYGFQNNRSNYTLANLEAQRNNFDKAVTYYELANAKRPTGFSLINQGNLYLTAGSNFNAIRQFRQALVKEPNSTYIKNNLGVAYAKVHRLDSASVLFEQARKRNTTKNTAEANFLALLGQEYIPVNVDSVHRLFEQTPLVQSNTLALATLQQQKISIKSDGLLSHPLDLGTATRLHNYIVYALNELDTAFISKAFKLASDPANEPYSEALKSVIAHAYYGQGNVAKAMALLAELGYLSQARQGEYNYLLGLWSLEQGAPEVAASHFENAVETNYKSARYYYAIALAEAGYTEEARAASEVLIREDNTTLQEIGRQLLKALTLQPSALPACTDLERYQFFRYRITTRDTLLLNRLTNDYQDDNYRALTFIEMSERLIRCNENKSAANYLNRAYKIKTDNPLIIQKLNRLKTLLLFSTGNDGPAAAHETTNTLTAKPETLLIAARLAENRRDETEAQKLYTLLARSNPFFEEGILAAAAYFKKHPENDLQVYNILTDAIYLNKYSYRLLAAYANEARKLGFDEYANGAVQRALEIRRRK